MYYFIVYNYKKGIQFKVSAFKLILIQFVMFLSSYQQLSLVPLSPLINVIHNLKLLLISDFFFTYIESTVMVNGTVTIKVKAT